MDKDRIVGSEKQIKGTVKQVVGKDARPNRERSHASHPPEC
jgi:uncharacterized protein YjbJ (UPF0337 family)